jgi:hypothetical protein
VADEKQGFLDWLQSLFIDEDKRASFMRDPQQALSHSGFGDVTGADVLQSLPPCGGFAAT